MTIEELERLLTYDGPWSHQMARELERELLSAKKELKRINGDLPPALENDRTAQMLGLVPDKRTPLERLSDAIRSGGASLKYRYKS